MIINHTHMHVCVNSVPFTTQWPHLMSEWWFKLGKALVCRSIILNITSCEKMLYYRIDWLIDII